MTSLNDIQRAVGVLIPEARECQKNLPPMDDSLPIAFELFFVAYAMKDSYARGGVKIAQQFCQRMGLDADEVEAFVRHRISEEIERYKRDDITTATSQSAGSSATATLSLSTRIRPDPRNSFDGAQKGDD